VAIGRAEGKLRILSEPADMTFVDETLRALTVASDTPGFVADVKAGASPTGPFDTVSDSQTVGGKTTFQLSVPSPEQYYLVWITRLAPGAPRTHISEVTAGG
jgi:hypothetical protein